MSNTIFHTNTEQWIVNANKVHSNQRKASLVLVNKIAVRDSNGRFHGSTNFRGTIAPV